MNQPLILPFNGILPRIHSSAYIAPTAVIIGDVEIGPESSVFYGSVLRADVNAIRIGARSNVQDNCVFHADAANPAILEDDVTVGHMALVHGAHVGAGSLIGMKSALLSGSRVGAGSLIAAGAVVLEGQGIPERCLAAGVPAKVRRELSLDESNAFIPHAAKYVGIAGQQARPHDALRLEDVYFD